MFDLHELDGLGHSARLIGIQLGGFACGYGAEGAGAGTDIAEDHKRGRTFAPALAHVGAVAALANGMQFIFVDDLAHHPKILAHGEFDAQPFGFFGALWLFFGWCLAGDGQFEQHIERVLEAKEYVF
jgi:hypothetical protein